MKRILFVDDEEHVLQALERTLRSERNQWEMTFVCGPEAALELLERETFDVVVADMRMPNIDGATLLARVKELHPATVRLVLSGYAEAESATRAAAVAHQFLSKPCDSAQLREVVRRTCNLQALLADESLREFVGGIGSLPVLPRLYRQLCSVLADPECSVVDIARLIERDMGMSAKLLQLVNTAFFGLPREVKVVSQAVAYLGVNMVRNLVLSTEIFRDLSPDERVPGFSVEQMQLRGRRTAAIAKHILNEQPGADDAFLAGMLHEIGFLILAKATPQRLAQILTKSRASGQPRSEVALELLGVRDGEIGGYLLGIWGLPHQVVEAVALHDRPDLAGSSGLDVVTAVHVAGFLVREVDGDPQDAAITHRHLEALGVDGWLHQWRADALALLGSLEGAAQ